MSVENTPKHREEISSDDALRYQENAHVRSVIDDIIAGMRPGAGWFSVNTVHQVLKDRGLVVTDDPITSYFGSLINNGVITKLGLESVKQPGRRRRCTCYTRTDKKVAVLKNAEPAEPAVPNVWENALYAMDFEKGDEEAINYLRAALAEIPYDESNLKLREKRKSFLRLIQKMAESYIELDEFDYEDDDDEDEGDDEGDDNDLGDDDVAQELRDVLDALTAANTNVVTEITGLREQVQVLVRCVRHTNARQAELSGVVTPPTDSLQLDRVYRELIRAAVSSTTKKVK